MKKDTSEKIEKLRREYTDILKTQSHQSIEDALKVLNYYHGLCRKYEHSTVRLERIVKVTLILYLMMNGSQMKM